MESSTVSRTFDEVVSRVDGLYARDSIEHQSLDVAKARVTVGDYETAKSIIENLQIEYSDKQELLTSLTATNTPPVQAYPESNLLEEKERVSEVPVPPLPPPPPPAPLVQEIKPSDVKEESAPLMVPPPPLPPAPPTPPQVQTPTAVPNDMHMANYDLIAQTKPTVVVESAGIEATKDLINKVEQTSQKTTTLPNGETKPALIEYAVPGIIKTYDETAQNESNDRLKEKERETQIQKAKPFFEKLELYMQKAYTTPDADSLIASAERQYTHLQGLYPEYVRHNADHISRINALRTTSSPIEEEISAPMPEMLPSQEAETEVSVQNLEIESEPEVEPEPELQETKNIEEVKIEEEDERAPYVPYIPPAMPMPVIPDPIIVAPDEVKEEITIPEIRIEKETETETEIIPEEAPFLGQLVSTPEPVPALPVEEEKNIIENPRVLHSYDVAGAHISWGMKISTDRDIYTVDRIQESKSQVTIVFRGGITGKIYFVPAEDLATVLGSDDVHPDEFFAKFVKEGA